MPNDLRVNPFVGSNYKNLVEKHIIPNVSPFVIRLNEVCEKHDPSNLEVFYVDEATGKVTLNQLTEVAASPAPGEFWPDYSTGAMEDTNWNTGLVEFNASEAGKIVEVRYTGMGELASLKSNHFPNWMTDYGDGSDGDFIPDGPVNISGVKNYKNVFIKAGVTVTVDGNAVIKCQETFINKGNIVVTAGGGEGGTDAGVKELYSARAWWKGFKGERGAASSGGAGGGERRYVTPGTEKTFPGYDAEAIFRATNGIANGSGGSGEYIWIDQ